MGRRSYSRIKGFSYPFDLVEYVSPSILSFHEPFFMSDLGGCIEYKTYEDSKVNFLQLELHDYKV